ncbi:hypothetical protein NU195Hw_g130t1 [Hortaea werneckii]
MPIPRTSLQECKAEQWRIYTLLYPSERGFYFIIESLGCRTAQHCRTYVLRCIEKTDGDDAYNVTGPMPIDALAFLIITKPSGKPVSKDSDGCT